MAKASTAPLAFKIETGVSLPPIQRNAPGGQSSPYTPVLKGMKLGATEKTMQSFFVPATVPDSITDAGEREKAAKDEARKISNRISGIARRLADEKDDKDIAYAFALRTRTEEVDGKPVLGVRVYRVAPPDAKQPAE